MPLSNASSALDAVVANVSAIDVADTFIKFFMSSPPSVYFISEALIAHFGLIGTHKKI